jgi:DMSO/TMAO reductase YedYZ molybdopterin-dependent catalytic subunit
MAEGHLESNVSGTTEIEDLFLVHHYARPDTAGLTTLTVVGTDGAEVSISHEKLRELPSRKVTAVLECAGNGRGLLARRAPGNQFGLGLCGQAQWEGTSLGRVLEEAGVDSDFETAVASALDHGVTMPEGSHDRFAKGLPRHKALAADTILAWSVNGEPIPEDHGGPLRLVVPGWYGIWWVKWCQRIELTAEQFSGFWQNQRYTYQTDDGTVVAPVADQRPRAVLVSPQPGARVHDGAELQFLAWAGEESIVLVEFSIDDGATWQSAEQVEDGGRWSWTRWAAELPPGLPRGVTRISVRATDSAGRQQAAQPDENRLGYGNNGIQVVEVKLVTAAPRAGG